MVNIKPIEIKSFVGGASVDNTYGPENGFYYGENIDIKNNLGKLTFGGAITLEMESYSPIYGKIELTGALKFGSGSFSQIYRGGQYRCNYLYKSTPVSTSGQVAYGEMIVPGGLSINNMLVHLGYIYTFRTDGTVTRFQLDNSAYGSYESRGYGSLGNNKLGNGNFDDSSAWTLGSGRAISGGKLTHTSGTDTVTQNITGLTSKKTITDTTTATDTFNLVGHGFKQGDRVFFMAGSGTLPSGISATTSSVYNPYYIINPTTDTFQVSLTLGGVVKTFTTDGSGFDCYYAKPYRIALMAESHTTGTLNVKIGTQTQFSINPLTSNYTYMQIRNVRGESETVTLTPSTDYNGSVFFVTVQEDLNKEFMLEYLNITGEAVLGDGVFIYAGDSLGKLYEINTSNGDAELMFDLPGEIRAITKIGDIFRIYTVDGINSRLYFWTRGTESPNYRVTRENVIVHGVKNMGNFDYMTTYDGNGNYGLWKCAEYEKQPITISGGFYGQDDRKTKFRFHPTNRNIVANKDEIFIGSYNRVYSYGKRKPGYPDSIVGELGVSLDRFTHVSIYPLLIDNNSIVFSISGTDTVLGRNTCRVAYHGLYNTDSCAKRGRIQTMPIYGTKRDSLLEFQRLGIGYNYKSPTSTNLISVYTIINDAKIRMVGGTGKTITSNTPLDLAVGQKVKFRGDSYYGDYGEYTIETITDKYTFTITESPTNLEYGDYILIKLCDIVDKGELQKIYNTPFNANIFSLVFESNNINLSLAPDLYSYTLYMNEIINE